MRTVPFQRVMDGIVRAIGLRPQNVDFDVQTTLSDYANERVRQAAQSWIWPEWTITEERAFRPLWNATTQFFRVGDNGQPDELFYIPNMTYYRVLSTAVTDPPIGTLPTDTTYFEALTQVEPYIAYDQDRRRSIGMVIGIYASDPRVNGCARGLYYSPGEKGISVRGSGPTVFIYYSMPNPVYSTVSYAAGKIYSRGDVVIDPTTGECFQALSTTTALPADASFWKRVPFLEVWMPFVKNAAASDAESEPDPTSTDAAMAQMKMAIAGKLETKAFDYLQSEIDALVAQGQKLKYSFCRRHPVWWESQPWGGGTVTTLTDADEENLGWVYPAPPQHPAVAWMYRQDMVGTKASLGASPAIDEIVTRKLLVGSLLEVVLPIAGVRTRRTYQLVQFAADPTDPGQIAPLDYDSTSNNKHWEQVT